MFLIQTYEHKINILVHYSTEVKLLCVYQRVMVQQSVPDINKL
jgi:hypothetical protein